jgi:polyribonucleotide 5'-hydroxyl-kinase
MTWLLDYVGYTRSNQPPWKVSLSTLSIVQSHYPERLGRAVNFKPPLLFEIFWKAIRPFVDPVTKEKLIFLSGKMEAEEYSREMEKYFNLDDIDECMGGTLEEGGMIPGASFKDRMLTCDENISQALKV